MDSNAIVGKFKNEKNS